MEQTTYELRPTASNLLCAYMALVLSTGIVRTPISTQHLSLLKKYFTCTMRTSPNVLKYSFKSCSVVFQGKPRTIKSEVFCTARFTFTADDASVSSIFLLLSEYNDAR